jgi:DNA invertase Pin-like site-specific DNA recombinase
MIAIYARQSVDKKDSLSIESQIEECKNKLTEEEARSEVYSDRGFSGKNTDRPQFQQMLEAIRDGSVKKIIVYKLDRISRSILDFSRMFAEFEKHEVQFLSCIENFDSSTPMGKAMLYIIAVFAQMERESIQQRIRDNYYARGEKGFYLGGPPAYGYSKVDFVIDNKKTHCYEAKVDEADIVQYLYEQFVYEHKSINELARWLNDNNVKKRRKGAWLGATVSLLLSSPIYVMADSRVYTLLRSKGATINNPVDDFIGENGCYTYGKTSDRKGAAKFKDYSTEFVTVAPHKGIVSSDLWLAAQERFEQFKGRTNVGTGSFSWLQGLVRCPCGYSKYATRFKHKNDNIYYFYCRGRINHACKADRKMFRTDKLESEVEKLILSKLNNLRNIEASHEQGFNPKINAYKIERQKAQENINNLIDELADGTTTAKYITERIESLDRRIVEIDSEIIKLERSERKFATKLDIDKIVEDWSGYGIEQKKQIARIFIEKIEIDGTEIDILMK